MNKRRANTNESTPHKKLSVRYEASISPAKEPLCNHLSEIELANLQGVMAIGIRNNRQAIVLPSHRNFISGETGVDKCSRIQFKTFKFDSSASFTLLYFEDNNHLYTVLRQFPNDYYGYDLVQVRTADNESHVLSIEHKQRGKRFSISFLEDVLPVDVFPRRPVMVPALYFHLCQEDARALLAIQNSKTVQYLFPNLRDRNIKNLNDMFSSMTDGHFKTMNWLRQLHPLWGQRLSARNQSRCRIR